MTQAEPTEFVAFALIIDDIVFPDGQTAMGTLGGGGPQTAFGMRLWAKRVGLSTGVGTDLPAPAKNWLTKMDIDLTGLRQATELPTPRAWQLLETDGRRTQVWRLPSSQIWAQLGHSINKLPTGYRQARGFHLGVHPENPDLDFIAALRDLGAVVSVEPFRAAQRQLSPAELQALLSAGQIFSPNEAEARSLVGEGKPRALIERLAAAGAQIVALRQGAGGALVHRAASGETWHIPAFETTVVDPTGAGNAFCGGFLAGWVTAGELRTAGLYGAVAASFLVEQVGLPTVHQTIFQDAAMRLNALQSQISATA